MKRYADGEKAKSVFEDIAHQIEGMDLDSAKEFLIGVVDKSKASDKSKRKMKTIIESKPTFDKLRYYVWDAMLAFIDPSLKVISEELEEEEVKLSQDLRLQVAEKLDQVAEMLDQAKKVACPACEEGLQFPEFEEDMPVFLIVQEMPNFMPTEPFEPTAMPDFNIQDMLTKTEE